MCVCVCVCVFVVIRKIFRSADFIVVVSRSIERCQLDVMASVAGHLSSFAPVITNLMEHIY